MSKKECAPELREVIAPFLSEPDKYFKFKELFAQIQCTETPLRIKLRELAKLRVLDVSNAVGRPTKKKEEINKSRRGSPEQVHRIRLNAEAYQYLLDCYSDKDVQEFLESIYSNRFIEKCGFEEAYRSIQPRLKFPEFKRIASISLLSLPSVSNYYRAIANELHDKILKSYQQASQTRATQPPATEMSIHLRNLANELANEPIAQIVILSDFEPLYAVRFYRDMLNVPLKNAYDELAENLIITSGLAEFLAFDNYLSPLNAHPLNSINKILFSKPFERIYEDAYLLEGDAFKVLSGRAKAIYNSFPDILYEYFKNDFYGKEDRKIIIKQMIHSWNVASTRFDIVCFILANLYEKKTGSGNYYLESNGLEYKITDLESGESLLPPDIGSSLLMFGSTPLTIKPDPQDRKRLLGEIMKEPFTILRPCYTFKDLRYRSEDITYAAIVKELEKKMKNRMRSNP